MPATDNDPGAARGRSAGGDERRDSVSACIITYNEAANISDCLDSVRWADEIIVVDSGSTDGTIEIARRFTDRVIVREWPGHVAQKNFAAEQARCDWVLSLDADERVSPELRQEITAVLEKGGAGRIGFWFPRRNFYLGKWWTRGGWYPDCKLRLWQRGRGRWAGDDPHDHVLLEGPTGRLSADLLHYSFRSVTDHVGRMNSYSSIAASAKLDRGVRFRRLDLVVRPPWRFFRMYLVQGAWRDGVAGLAMAAVETFYVFLKYLKMWEHERFAGTRPPGSGEGPGPAPEPKPPVDR
jgi:glycosyltransferase involved in cell wall biosynthesis